MFADQVGTEIAAPADRLYDLVADVTGTVDRSPEVPQVEWLGEPGPVVGARFRGRSRWRGFTWWRHAEIITAERGREFTFRTIPGRGIYHDTTTWRYRFEPTPDQTTRVTESDQRQAPWWLRTMDTVLGRPTALHRGMQGTLAALKHTAETPRHRGRPVM